VNDEQPKVSSRIVSRAAGTIELASGLKLALGLEPSSDMPAAEVLYADADLHLLLHHRYKHLMLTTISVCHMILQQTLN
jgi:hypothetical protein